MPGPLRIGVGTEVDPEKPLRFCFDGRWMQGFAGDTLASALLANGVRVVARSFKYHRPRGLLTAGHEEPNALVDVIEGDVREPNVLATTLRLYAGVKVASQNRWPSLRFDALAINDRLGRFLPAGFYYKTFMSPGWAWERLYEPAIRRAAGFGRIDAAARRPPPSGTHRVNEIVHDHCDVLIVGAGAAGLTAARALGSAGLRVQLVDQQHELGGGTRLDQRWQPWRDSMCAALQGMKNVHRLPATTVIGAYEHGVFATMQELPPGEIPAFEGMRERLRIVRARRVLIASGAVERLIAFPGNDRPGVMMAGAALNYLHRFGVAVGHRPAWFVNNDEAYESALALRAAGIECAGVIDVRADSMAAARARAAGIEVHAAAIIDDVAGRHGVRSLRVRSLSDGRSWRLKADCLLVSGGHSPSTALACQQGADLTWNDPIAAFVAKLAPESGQLAGAARGVFGIEASARDGAAAARQLATQLGVNALAWDFDASSLPTDPRMTPVSALWEVPGTGKSFVDLQNDVTTADVRLAALEGYEHVEHMKRYTTHGMGADQGRTGGLVGSAVLAAALGKPLQSVGQAKPRPYAQPVPLAVLAGEETGVHFKPKRRLPLHDWHGSAGATFVSLGLWLRPLVYAREGGWDAVLTEARHVRSAVGITDVSTLGKIDVQGADAAQFLDHIYANTFSTLPVGRARYGIMLREDAMLLDDGTTSRLGPQHFLVTTTTANAAAILEHMEFQLQAHCRQLDVMLTDVSDQWAQFAIAGPNAREVVASVTRGLDLDNSAFPFMAAAPAQIAGIAGRIFRISFSGELAYEVAVPANRATETWLALLEAGKPRGIRPYGLDALNSLRIEKGHVTAAELNGNTSADDLGFQRLLKARGDFVGRALAQRASLAGAGRLQLVGVRPTNSAARLRNGAHLVTADDRKQSLGYLTSVTPSVASSGWLGLALLSEGRRRIGERLHAHSPLHDEFAEVSIVSPHMYDPENARVRG